MAEEKKSKQTKKNSTKGTKASVSETKTKSVKSTSTKTAKSTSTQKNKTTTTKKKNVTSSKTIPPKANIKKDDDKKIDSIKQEKVIEINQKRLVIGIIICILIVVFCLVCFFGSNSFSSKYEKSNKTEESSDSSGGNEDILAQATKESGEVSDDERTAPNDISVDDYLELYQSDELSLVLLSKESCSYCKLAIPIIENIIYENNVDINRVDVGDLSSDDTSKLIGSDEYFSQGYGTPLLMVVGNNSIKDKIEGLTTKDEYKEFFKKYGFME